MSGVVRSSSSSKDAILLFLFGGLYFMCFSFANLSASLSVIGKSKGIIFRFFCSFLSFFFRPGKSSERNCSIIVSAVSSVMIFFASDLFFVILTGRSSRILGMKYLAIFP